MKPARALPSVHSDSLDSTRVSETDIPTDNDVPAILGALSCRNHVAMRVQGSSMLPWIRHSDIAIVRRTSLEAVRTGDVVLFRRGERLFAHRAVQTDRIAGQILSKGDANRLCDGAISREELLGVVTCVFRNDRRIDLDSGLRKVAARLAAQISLRSDLWYPTVRAAAVATRPARRFLRSVLFADASAR
jgi:hypothetical protein